MIPIRRYPYTDFHDLNLDFILKQFNIYELDIEELKRRVKALEDWRTETEPIITTIQDDIVEIKGDISDIKGDISDIKDDIDDIKDDISDIKDDIEELDTTVADHTSRLTKDKINIQNASSIIKASNFPFSFSSYNASVGWEWTTTNDTEYPVSVKINILKFANSLGLDMRKWYNLPFNGDLEEKSKVDLLFAEYEDYELFSANFCSYIEIEDPDINGELGYITIRMKERMTVSIEHEIIPLYIYATTFTDGNTTLPYNS